MAKRNVRSGTEFQQEVEWYFKRVVKDSKYGTVSNRGTRPGADIIVTLNNVSLGKKKNFKLLVQAKDINGRINIDSLANEYENRVRREHANKALIIINSSYINAINERGRSVRFNDTLRDKYLQDRKVLIWDKKVYDCYKNLITTLGFNSVYQLFSDLKYNANFDKKDFYKTPYFSVTQKDTTFKITKIPSDILLKTGYVLRRNLNVTDGFQRLLNKNRVNTKIPQDIAAAEPAERLFPSSVICYYDGKLTEDRTGNLLIPLKYGQLSILDGQHRVYGIANAKDKGNFELPCVIIEQTLNRAQQAQLFISVNKKAVKPPANLLLDLDTDSILTQLAKKLNESKLFSRSINFNELEERKDSISATTFINGGGLKSILDEKLKNGGKKRNGYLTTITKDNFDSYYNMLWDYFDLWQRAFKKQWGKPKKYVIASNRGIRIIFRFFRPLIEYYGKPNSKRNKKKILKLLKYLQKRMNEKKLSKIVNIKGQYLGGGGAKELYNNLISLVGGKDFDFECKAMPFKESLDLQGIEGEEELRIVFARAHKTILIADRYFDRNALFNIGTDFKCKDIKILITDEHSIAELRQKWTDFKNELSKKGINGEIRILNKITYPVHYTYIILDEKLEYSGDIRLNMLGKDKITRLHKLNNVKDISNFNQRWVNATKIENYP